MYELLQIRIWIQSHPKQFQFHNINIVDAVVSCHCHNYFFFVRSFPFVRFVWRGDFHDFLFLILCYSTSFCPVPLFFSFTLFRRYSFSAKNSVEFVTCIIVTYNNKFTKWKSIQVCIQFSYDENATNRSQFRLFFMWNDRKNTSKFVLDFLWLPVRITHAFTCAYYESFRENREKKDERNDKHRDSKLKWGGFLCKFTVFCIRNWQPWWFLYIFGHILCNDDTNMAIFFEMRFFNHRNGFHSNKSISNLDWCSVVQTPKMNSFSF